MNDHDRLIRAERDVHWQRVMHDRQRACDQALIDEKLRSRDLALQLQAAVQASQATALSTATVELAQAKGAGSGTARLIAAAAALVVVVSGIVAFAKL